MGRWRWNEDEPVPPMLLTQRSLSRRLRSSHARSRPGRYSSDFATGRGNSRWRTELGWADIPCHLQPPERTGPAIAE